MVSPPRLRLTFALMAALLIGLAGGAVGQERGAPHAVGMLSVRDLPAEVRQDARRAVRGAEEGAGSLAKVGHELALLYYQYERRGTAGVRALREASAGGASARRPAPRAGDETAAPRVRERRVRSPVSPDGRTVAVEAFASEDPFELRSDLRRLGMRGTAATGTVVSGRLPISEIEAAAGLASLRGMLPSYAATFIGSVDSEADSAHRAKRARLDSGVDGSGQKVCALSDSYDQDTGAATSAADDVASGDLPGDGNPEGNTTPVDVLRDDVTDGSDEGRAMLQLIHDIAPGAELGFHTAFGGLGVFADGIRALADAGCTVIVDDIIFLAEPFYQDGPIALAADEVVDDGIPYFSSAGNNGQDSYEAEFRGSGETGVLADTSEAHDFDPGTFSTDTRQEITIGVGGRFRVFSLQWTDPSALSPESSQGPDTDLDVALVNQADSIVAQSALNNIGNVPTPFESFEFENDGSIDTDNDGVADSTFSLVIERAEGPAPDEVKYIYEGQDFEVEEFDTLGPTVFGHAMAEGAEAVAAAPFFNTAAFNENVESAVLESFSSRGGIDILFDENGNELASPESRQKPEVTGTDGVDNTFFGFDIDIGDPDSDPNFFGTSAAAPNVAAVAGLIRQADPSLRPTEVYDRIESTAADVTRRFDRDGTVVFTGPNQGTGVDDWSGFGFVQADAAVPALEGVQLTEFEADPSVTTEQSAVELSWRQVGEGEVDAFVVEKRFFDGAFIQQQSEAQEVNAGSFSSTFEDLPIGTHSFRLRGVVINEATQDTLTVAENRTSVTLRRQEEVDVLAFPNPFRSTVNLSVTLPEGDEGEQEIRVEVFDALGRQVATPVASRTIGDAESISFDAGAFRRLSSGVYFVRVEGETFTETVQVTHVQ